MAAITVTDASHSSHLVDEFVSMRKAGELFDYEIKGRDESFPIHSLVLASMSGMFKVMLKSNMAESAKREAAFPTIPDGIMRKIIDFAYTGTCTFARDELKPLITAAHYLQMAKLQRVCEEKISAVLQPSNCFSWLRYAEGLELDIIAPQVRKMMFTLHKEVIKSDEFLSAETSEIAEYLSSLSQKSTHGDTLVEAILQWLKNDIPYRSVHIPESFTCISLGRCTQTFLSKIAYENIDVFERYQNVNKMLNKSVSQLDKAQTLLILGGQLDNEVTNNECWILKENEMVKFAETPCEQIKRCHSMCQVPQGVMLTGGVGSNLCKIFDVASKSWIDRANLLSGRHQHGSGYLSGKVFVIGGERDDDDDDDGDESTRSVDYMDLDANTWHHGPDIPDSELLPKVAVCNSMLYVLLTKQGRLYGLDGEGMSWTEKSDIPTASLECSLAAVEDKLLAAGGSSRINCMYTPISNTWCRLTGPSLLDGWGTLVHYQQRLLLIGGCKGYEQRADVEEYDFSSDSWSLTAWKLPKPLMQHEAFVFDLTKS